MTQPQAPNQTAREQGPWALVPKPNPAARLRLICIHSAGGGASMYRRWPASFPPDIEVILAQLPGREARIREPPLESFTAAVDDLVSALAPYLGGRYALFGHSMGSLLALGLAEVAPALRADYRIVASTPCTSTCQAPSGPEVITTVLADLSSLPDRAGQR